MFSKNTLNNHKNTADRWLPNGCRFTPLTSCSFARGTAPTTVIFGPAAVELFAPQMRMCGKEDMQIFQGERFLLTDNEINSKQRQPLARTRH